MALTTVFNLASATDLTRAIREEVSFFQAIRAALAKSVSNRSEMSSADRHLAVRQIRQPLADLVEIVDIL